MPDEDGYLVAGELQVGSYAAGEFDLGERLCGPLGFTAVERDEEVGVWEDVPVAEGFSTVRGELRYVSPDQVESWGLFRWRTA